MSLAQHLSKVGGHLRAAAIPKKQAKLYKNAAKRVLGRAICPKCVAIWEGLGL